MDKSIPLNLDLTCFEINSTLEDSLATASSVLSLVKTIEPNIITIQCIVTEDTLDYILFKKLPANNYARKFTKSSDINKKANSCVAWKTFTYTATPVDLLPLARLFPQTNLDCSTMVHLWPKTSGAIALTVISWNGLFYSQENKERTLYFETFLKFVGVFRSLNNYKLRVLIGGLYNVDLKVTQFWRFPDLVPLVYTNRPNPNERRELKCSFIYTKDNLKMLDHNVSKIGDKNGEYWAINTQVVAIHVEKGDLNIYSTKNVGQMEEILAARSQPGQQVIVRSANARSTKSNLEVNIGDDCSLKDTASTTTNDSGGTFSSGPVENGPDTGKNKFKLKKKDTKSTTSDSTGNLSSGTVEEGPGRQNEKLTMGAPSSPKFSTRRAAQAYFCHVERNTRSASAQRLLDPSDPGDKIPSPKSPTSRRNEQNIDVTNGDLEGNENTDCLVLEKPKVEADQRSKTNENGKPITMGGLMRASIAFPPKKTKSTTDEDKIIPMDKINEESDDYKRSLTTLEMPKMSAT